MVPGARPFWSFSDQGEACPCLERTPFLLALKGKSTEAKKKRPSAVFACVCVWLSKPKPFLIERGMGGGDVSPKIYGHLPAFCKCGFRRHNTRQPRTLDHFTWLSDLQPSGSHEPFNGHP